MKVILSRKSMDSQYGKIASPIIKSEFGYQKFYPLPIPFPKEQAHTKYADLKLFDNFSAEDFIKDIRPKFADEYCHLDPDLRESYLNSRPADWKRAFGQVGASQSHLENCKVDVGDIFLYFGWFQFAEYSNGKFRYLRDEFPEGFHAIYGYLQIDKIFKPNLNDEIPDWLTEHAHIKNRSGKYFNIKNNTVYVAKELIEYPKAQFNKNGAINFVFNEKLILTKRGQKNRSLWEFPKSFHPEKGVELTYNYKNWSYDNDKAILKSAGKGQEFVFKNDSNGEVENWCIDLIRSCSVTD